MVLYDKVYWHLDGGEDYDEVIERFTDVVEFLKENDMLNEYGLEEFEDGVDETAIICVEQLTEIGNEFIKKYYDKALTNSPFDMKKAFNKYLSKYLSEKSINENNGEFAFIKQNGEIILVKYNGVAEKVVIPDMFEGELVTAIGKDAFSFTNHSVNIVVLPNNLKTIYGYAFRGCEGLKEIILPKSMEKVASNAFSKCYSLKKVVALSKDTKVAPTAFNDCDALEEVSFSIVKILPLPTQLKLLIRAILQIDNLPIDQQEEIKSYIKKKPTVRKALFLNDDSDIQIITFLLELKTKITLELLDEYINNSIEKENTSVKDLLLEYQEKSFTKKTIEEFDKNKELVEKGIELPTLKQFKSKWICKKLSHIHQYSSPDEDIEGKLCITGYKGDATHEIIPREIADGTQIARIHFYYFPEKKLRLCSITHLKIEAPVKKVGGFSESNLVEIILPDTVESIFDFRNCKKLKTVILSKNIKTIEVNTFLGCTSLEFIGLEGGENRLHEFINL